MNKNKLRMIQLLLVVLMVVCLVTACSSNDVRYNFIDEDSLLVDGERDDNTDGAFDNVGIYTDPELEIDGVRDEEYDYPTGSGRHEVYIEGNEQTYVSIYKGETAIYFLFECKDEYLSALTVEDINISTAQSDSVELYLSTYGLGGKTMTSTDYEFRVSVASRVYSYLTGFVAKVFTYGTLNNSKDIDEGFNVEGYISYSVLGPDVDKYTPTSFAFARVTKSGNTGYVWHGAVDPQVPDNYLTLHTDNKFYTLDECPVSATVSGTVKDIHNQPISLAKIVTSAGEVGFTDTNGNYKVKLDGTTSFQLSFEKNGYLTYVHSLSKQELMKESNITYNQVLLNEDESSYKTTFEGKITERDGTTPIQGATVTVNDDVAITDSSGRYSFSATCYGYENQLTFSADNHTSYQKTVHFSDIAVEQSTGMETVALDESFGATVGFGNDDVGFGQARVLRNADGKSFKVLLKTDQPMDGLGSYFELFVDTKDSSAFNKRDSSDYRLDISYTDGLVGFQNYGDLTVPRTGFNWTSGRINELYFVEVDIDYDFIGVDPDEIFGLYFAIKCNWNWAGMYDHNNNYIQAEYPRNYLRLDVDSTLFKATANTEPAPSGTVTYINEIGNFASFGDAIKYKVSVYRDADGVTIALEQLGDVNVDMATQSHSLNIYFDTNYDGSSNLDENCYHISVYPGMAVSSFRQYDSNGLEQNKFFYEEDINQRFEVRYKNKLYIHLSYEIFGGTEDSVIVFAMGYWNDAAAANDFLRFDGKQPDFADPSTFIQVAPDGTVTVGG